MLTKSIKNLHVTLSLRMTFNSYKTKIQNCDRF
jgi:hypothetical protein